MSSCFNPRTLLGHDDAYLWQTIENKQFQSTRPVRGRDNDERQRDRHSYRISIHAPLAGRDSKSDEI